MYFTTIRTRALCEQERRRNLSTTYTEPLEISSSSKPSPTAQSPLSESFPEDELDCILEEFHSTVPTPEQMAKNEMEMEEHPILKVHFEALVPRIVSYEDFWKRYYYRCYDLNRIVSELKQQDERQELAKEPEETKNNNTINNADHLHQQEEDKSSVRTKESFECVQGRILHMASSSPTAIIHPKMMENEEVIKDDGDNPDLTTTFDSSLTFGSASFNVIPIETTTNITTTHTQTIAEPTSEKPRDYPLFPMEKEEAEFLRNHHHHAGIEADGDSFDDGASLGSSMVLPDNLSDVTSVVTNPDHIHRYPDSPDFCDHDSEEGKSTKAAEAIEQPDDEVSDTETASALDDRLAGALVFILNDEILKEDNELGNKILEMGGRVTENLKGATHALWVPPNSQYSTGVFELDHVKQCQESWEEFKDTVIVTLAESYEVPIVDSDRWLPQIARLEFEEHWSDVNSEDFHPERTQTKISRSPKRYKVFKSNNDETQMKHKQLSTESSKKKLPSISNPSPTKGFKVTAIINILILLVVVLSACHHSGIFFPSKSIPTNPSITKRRKWKQATTTTSGNMNRKTNKIPWWRKLLGRYKRDNNRDSTSEDKQQDA